MAFMATYLDLLDQLWKSFGLAVIFAIARQLIRAQFW